MKVETRKEMKEVLEEVFIADDGTEFDNVIKCRMYEYKLKQKKALEILKKIEKIIELDEEYLNEWICVEHEFQADDLTYNCSDCYTSHLEDNINHVKELFKALGYEVEFKKIDEA